MLTFDNLIISAINGNTFDNLGVNEEVIAYLPLAWIGDHSFPTPSHSRRAFASIVRRAPETVFEDRREIGATYGLCAATHL